MAHGTMVLSLVFTFPLWSFEESSIYIYIYMTRQNVSSSPVYPLKADPPNSPRGRSHRLASKNARRLGKGGEWGKQHVCALVEPFRTSDVINGKKTDSNFFYFYAVSKTSRIAGTHTVREEWGVGEMYCRNTAVLLATPFQCQPSAWRAPRSARIQVELSSSW